MTRTEKKCLFFSVTMHALLIVTLFVSSAFRTRPEERPVTPLTMIPANLLDRDGAGGGGVEHPTPQPQRVQQQAPPAPVPVTPQPVQPVKPVVHTPPVPVQPIEPPHPKPVVEEPQDTPDETAVVPAPKPVHKRREIQPTFDPITPSMKARQERDEAVAEAKAAAAAARARANRMHQLANAFNGLEEGVAKGGAATGTIVDVKGIGEGNGGGPAFAGYRDAVFSYYNRAWVRPDDASSRMSSADAKIVVSRDGTIISAEIISRSGERSMDRSVDRVLKAVTKLPPFPKDAQDDERTFIIRFNLESNEASG